MKALVELLELLWELGELLWGLIVLMWEHPLGFLCGVAIILIIGLFINAVSPQK